MTVEPQIQQKCSGLTIITACLPTASTYLDECADSVAEVRAVLSWLEIEWIVAIDGPGEISAIAGADEVVRLPVRRGISVARNYAFGAASHPLVVALDADDLLEADGVRAGVELLMARPDVGWIAANRTLVTGEKTVHWHGERRWAIGEVAGEWAAPMAFHSNTLITRSNLIREAGGWPALSACEDLLLALRLGEIAPGESIAEVLIRYRAWEGQATASEDFLEEQTLAYRFIESSINATRGAHGRPSIESPEPLGGLGSLPL